MASTASPAVKQFFTPNAAGEDSAQIQSLVKTLNLIPHIEGGFFVETDRAPDLVPSPFPVKAASTAESHAPSRPGFDPAVRNSSTTIFYLLTPNGPQGGFHRNSARTVHTLHKGRAQYVLIHADEEGREKRVETFVVGQNVQAGEKLQWIVEGGKFKASFLLPDENGESEGCLISETVVPGFEFCDHDFLDRGELVRLVGEEKKNELEWLLSPLAN